MQYSVRNIKIKKAKRMYLSLVEKKRVIIECGDSALIMYEFYVSKGGAIDYHFTDKKTAYSLGWEESKAQRIRLKLEKYKYIKTITFSNQDKKYTVTYLGKENVRKAEESGAQMDDVLQDERVVTIETTE